MLGRNQDAGRSSSALTQRLAVAGEGAQGASSGPDRGIHPTNPGLRRHRAGSSAARVGDVGTVVHVYAADERSAALAVRLT